MHRLFWKVFLSFWAALILFSALVMLAASHYLDTMREQGGAFNPIAQLTRYTKEAQTAIDTRGRQGLLDWARNTDRCEAIPVLVLDSRGHDLLGRQVPERVVEHVQRRSELPPPPQRDTRLHPRPVVQLSDGTEYRLLMDFEGVTLGRILRRPRVIALPLLIAALISGAVGFLLARYLARPIEKLQATTESYADGDLSLRVGPSLGRRRDEIVDLAHAFDRMAERLDALMKSQKQLLTDVSHELRTPLARLQAALGLARQRAGDRAQPELDRIDREAERLNELIGQLLSLARLESGMQTPKMEPVDLIELLQTVTADAALEARARDRDVTLETAVAHVSVHGNPSLLHSAVENVVRNAIRYTPEHTTVAIRLEPDPRNMGWLRLSIRDHGPGVPDEMIPRLFEPFVRVGHDRDRSSGGHGLGLAIADRAVRLHGGEITAHNEPDGGLTVAVRLPSAAT
jgi:two-component system sensor histidine kinase CpxA